MKHIVSSCLLIAAFGCSSQGGTGTGGKVVDNPPKPTNDVAVELAAVTLADDCGGNLTKPPVSIQTAAIPAKEAKRPAAPPPVIATPADEPAQAPAAVAASCAQGTDCGGHYRSCDQTSMQLSLRATGQGGKIEVKKVELLDDSGKLVGELTAKAPMRWTTDKYETWNQQVAANETLSISYALSSPPYDKLQGGRWEAHNKKFQLRVTIVVEGKERTVEKKAIAPTQMEPAVPT